MSQGKFIIHIGLPKTATTTLQIEVFPKLVNDKIEYIGAVQPRDKGQTELYRQIYNVIESKLEVQLVHDVIKKKLLMGHTLILSEEMIVVSGRDLSWKDKLVNLSKLVSGLNYEIIVTVREPSSAMFSYYCERYPSFSKDCKNFMDCALEHKDMQIFYYKKLLDTLLESFELKKIHMFKFEDIVKGKIAELVKIIDPHYQNSSSMVLQNQNFRKKTSTHVVTRYSTSLLDIPRKILDIFKIRDLWVTRLLKKPLKPVIKLIDKIKLKPIKVPNPSNDEMEKLRLLLAEETAELEKTFGILYE